MAVSKSFFIIPGIFCFVILPKLFFVCMHAQIMISIKKTSYYITVYNGKQFLGDLMNGYGKCFVNRLINGSAFRLLGDVNIGEPAHCNSP